MPRFLLPAAILATAATPLWAEVPAVATDIAPVHALVARVMEGLGTPELIVPPAASPHGYAMRPSEARALSVADLVVWVGPPLTPWLAEPLTSLAGNASHLALIDQPGTRVMTFRDGATFEAHDHAEEGQSEQNHEDHAHEDHENHGEEGQTEEGQDHAEHENAGHDHSQGGIDGHVWLDPRNAQLWLGQIAEALAELDPENANQYRANAEAGQAELTALEAEIDAILAPVRRTPYIVFHDAYHYFEARFDIEAAGAISENDARAPGAARVAELRALVSGLGAKCVFAEPQFNPGLIAAVAEGQELGTGTLDPIGASLEPGPTLYPELLRGMAEAMADCLSQ